MYISPVTNIKYYNNNRYKPKAASFTAHPDFYKFNSTQSCYFRRGAVVLSSKGYNDIENLFADIFTRNENKPKSMLIIGIGHSQEPFSYLSSISGIIKDKPLNKNVDLYTVDLQSMPSENELKNSAFCNLREYETFPKYAKRSIVKDNYKKWMGEKEYIENSDPINKLLYEFRHKEQTQPPTLYERVNDEVFEFLKSTYNNSQKSKWDSAIQEVIQDYPDKKFDMVSANNVLPYIVSEADIIKTILHINRALKKGGYFITDPYNYPQSMIDAGVLDNFREINPGIYQKIC